MSLKILASVGNIEFIAFELNELLHGQSLLPLDANLQLFDAVAHNILYTYNGSTYNPPVFCLLRRPHYWPPLHRPTTTRRVLKQVNINLHYVCDK